MISVETAKEVYPAVEELIKRLESHPTSKLSAILDHRMHKVAWTVGDELFQELNNVLTSALAKESATFDAELRAQIEQLLSVIRRHIVLK